MNDIIETAIKKIYLTAEQPDVAAVIEEVQLKCFDAKTETSSAADPATDFRPFANSPRSLANNFRIDTLARVRAEACVTLRRPGASAVPRLLHRELPAAGQSRAALRVNVRRAPHCYGWRPSPAWKHSAIDTGLT